MNTRKIAYCEKCNEIPSTFSIDGGRTNYCLKCRSSVNFLGNGIHVRNNTLVAIGEQTGSIAIPEGVTNIYPGSLNSTSIKEVQFAHSLKTIPFECFKDCPNIEEVVIPQTITKIDGHAFKNCIGLKKVVFDGETEINNSAFDGCTNLREVVVKGSIKFSWPHSTPFEGCQNLEQITFLRTAKIEPMDFSKITNLKKVICLCPVKETSGWLNKESVTFKDCKKLEEVQLEAVEVIGGHTFSRCAALKKITIGKSTKRIERYALYGCTSLETIEIPEGCVELSGFNGCESLKHIPIPRSVKKLGDNAFSECKQFESFIVPEGIEELGNRIFENCTNLKEIILPSSLKRIGSYTFKGCAQLEKLAIPDGVEELEEFMFESCSNLREIHLPSTLKRIGIYAFKDCVNLEKVVLSEGLQEIGNWAFKGCSRIRVMMLPASLKKIGDDVFQSLPIHLVILPRGITELGSSVFEERWSRYSQQKHQYVAASNAYVEGYLKENGLKYEVTTRKNGALLEAPIADGILYYLKPKDGKIEIPSDVEIIDSEAISDQETVKEILLSDSVLEVKAGAFAGCSDLEHVDFGGNIEKIGAKSFWGLRDQIIDLPASVKDLAPDAFGEGCIISIAGEMPFYHTKLAEIEATRNTVKEKESQLVNLEAWKNVLETNLDAYQKSMPPSFARIPQYQEQVFLAEQSHIDRVKKVNEKLAAINAQINQIQGILAALSEQREKCFFLAVSKKKELDESIQLKKQELDFQQEKLNQLEDEAALNKQFYLNKLIPAKRKLDELLLAQTNWEEKMLAQVNAISDLQENLQMLGNEIINMRALADDAEQVLQQNHKNWCESREAFIANEKTGKLLTEKTMILSGMELPTCDDIEGFTYKRRKAISEEVMLNKAFLEMINAWNYERKAAVHNQFVESHSNEIKRVKEINMLLGYAEDDGIAEFYPLEVSRKKDNFIPARFLKLNAWFGRTKRWQSFVRNGKTNAFAEKSENRLTDRFFAGCDYFCISDESKILFIFPYCMVSYEPNKPLIVRTYDKVKLSVGYTERTETGYSTPKGGELVNMEFMYLNKDGSPSKRYKDNPVIKTYRFTHVTLSDTRDSVIFPFATYNAALQFENAFNTYQTVLTEGEYCDIYKEILKSSDLEIVDAAIQNHVEAEKRRDDEKKKRAEAKRIAAKVAAEAQAKRAEEERRAAIAAAEEEKKRVEAERLAAQAAAEEKRRAIIQRQKELNEERKRQATEKKRIYSLFEDDHASEAPEREEKPAIQDAPLEVISKRTISNNVFKVQAKQIVQTLADDTICYFTSTNGTVISNKKTLINGALGNEMTIGFVLTSGVDFTQMSSCLMRIESQGVALGEIEFKMSISFYSDF